jgi:hypothetical protein
MNFKITKTKLANSGCVFYAATDLAFSTHPWPSSAGSVVVNDIELLIDLDERVVGLSGYCPKEGWIAEKFDLPALQEGSVYCHGGLDEDGIAKRYEPSAGWKAAFDSEHQTVCVYRIAPERGQSATKVIEGLSLGFEAGDLVRIWLRISRAG